MWRQQKLCVFFNLLRVMVGVIMLTSIFLPSAAVRGQEQEKPITELIEAERKYYKGFFDEAADLISGCLSQGGLTIGQQVRAYRLFGLIYIAKNELPKAKTFVRKLFELAPTYEPDPEENPQEFVELVKEVRQELQAQQLQPKPSSEKPSTPVTQTEKRGSKKWLWFGGGGAVAAGAIAFLISRGEERPPRLPDPPALPRKE
jgi:hypothetical protein